MREKLRNFSELVMFEHTIFSAAFSLMALILAGFELYTRHLDTGYGTLARVAILSALALIVARNFAMGFNRLCDRHLDRLNPRTATRPSVDGRINLASLIGFCTLNALTFIVASYFINPLAFKLSIPFLLILGFYSFCKRFSVLSHWVLGVCLGLAPIASAIAVLGEIEIWSVYLAVGVMFWVAGFDLLYSLQDMEFDRQKGLFSVPARFGEAATLRISRVCHGAAVLFWALFLCDVQAGFFGFCGVLIAAAMLCYEQYLVAKDFQNIPKAFFVTNGYLGFIFLGFILLDVMVRAWHASIG